jgi:hypothetical protein
MVCQETRLEMLHLDIDLYAAMRVIRQASPETQPSGTHVIRQASPGTQPSGTQVTPWEISNARETQYNMDACHSPRQ